MKAEIIRYIILGIFIISVFYGFISNRKSNENKRFFKWSNEKEIFKSSFLKSIFKSSRIKYYIIEFDEYYIQYLILKKANLLHCEIISNEFLEEKAKLKNTQIEEILNLNFLKPNTKGNRSKNFLKIYRTEKENKKEKVINELIYLIEKIGIKEDSFLRIRYK